MVPRWSAFLLVLVFVLVCIPHSVTCQEIYFNSSALGCELPTGCNWEDPSIWVGGVVPVLETDVVVIHDTRENTKVVYNNSTLKLFINTLTLHGVHFEVISSTFSADTFNLTNATLTIDGSAHVVSYEETFVYNDSYVYVNGGTFTQALSGVEFVLDETSTLVAGAYSTLLLNTMNYLYGVFQMHPSSTFSGDTIVFYRDVSLSNIPYLSSVVFRNGANGTFQSGLYAEAISIDPGSVVQIFQAMGNIQELAIQTGATLYIRSVYTASSIMRFVPTSGTLVISSSNITLSNEYGDLYTQLIIGGSCGVYFSGIGIYSLSFTNGEFGEPPYISMGFINEMVVFEFANPIQIPGDMLIQNTQLYIYGDINLSGGIISKAGPLIIRGTLTTGSPIELSGTEPPYTLMTLYASVITTPLLHFQPVTGVYNYGNSTVNGNVLNEGLVRLAGTDIITIQGDYTQKEDALLVLVEIDPLINKTGFISVTGSATVGGSIVYSVENGTDTDQTQFLILFAAKGVHGTFKEPLANDGPGNATVKLHYNSDSVYILYGGKEPHHDVIDDSFLGIVLWTWILIACIAVLFIIIVPTIYYFLRVRGRYDPVPENQLDNPAENQNS